MFGNITPHVVYYVHSIIDGNDFTISATQGGSVLVLTDAVGGATLISNDYAFTIADNGTTAALVFASTYDVTTDYLTYTIIGETLPVQYGYTLPQVQLFTGNNSTVSFTLTNYVGDNNPNNAIVEIDGIRQTQTAYTISSISNTILFSSPPPAASTVAVTTYNQTQRQYLNTQYNITGSTVSNIVNIDNSLSTVRVVTGINHNFAENDLIRIDGVSGSIQLNNNTYYVNIINSTEFDLYNQPYNPAATNYPVTGVSAYTSGGYAWLDQLFTVIDTVATRTTANGNRITVDSTDIIVPNTPVLFTTFGANIGDNILGGILANTQYYVYEVNPTILAGNFIVGNSYQIIELGTTDFTTIGAASNTVSVIFTATGVGSGTGLASGLQEFTITSDRYPNQAQVVLTDATGSINVSEFEQVNVDRLWVTVNGYRVPSSALKLNLFNNLSILTTIQTGDQVIITSMMPTATPNEQVYLLNVSMSNEPTVYRANTQARTWLTQPLLFTDTTIYLHDVTHVTDNVVQNVICPAAVDGKYNIGLTANKNAICLIVVYNETTSTMVNPANFTIIIVDTSPILQISSQVTVGDSLTITSTVGRLVYINGEQIAFTECDLVNNTLSQLTRGANGTGVRGYTPIYTEVFGLIPSNVMSDVLYSTVWNPIPGVYNTTEGDPLQIAYSQGADFLRTDRN
jgi:phosphotransferase system IIB component